MGFKVQPVVYDLNFNAEAFRERCGIKVVDGTNYIDVDLDIECDAEFDPMFNLPVSHLVYGVMFTNEFYHDDGIYVDTLKESMIDPVSSLLPLPVCEVKTDDGDNVQEFPLELKVDDGGYNVITEVYGLKGERVATSPTYNNNIITQAAIGTWKKSDVEFISKFLTPVTRLLAVSILAPDVNIGRDKWASKFIDELDVIAGPIQLPYKHIIMYTRKSWINDMYGHEMTSIVTSSVKWVYKHDGSVIPNGLGKIPPDIHETGKVLQHYAKAVRNGKYDEFVGKVIIQDVNGNLYCIEDATKFQFQMKHKWFTKPLF